MTDRAFRNSLTKMLNKPRPADEFVPYSVSINKWCECEGKPEYYIPIRNRIYREIEENPRLGDYVYLCGDNIEDLCISDDGLCIFSDILMGYFDLSVIRNIFERVSSRNKIAQLEWCLDTTIKSLSVKTLKEWIKEFDTEETQELKEKVQQELNRRRIFKRPKRAV